MRVEVTHFRIFRETHNAEEDTYWIENLSGSGTIVEDYIVKDRNKHKLQPGDKIGCLLIYLSEMKYEVIQIYAFCPSRAVKENNKLKRSREDKQEFQEEVEEQEKHKKLRDGHQNNLECTICLSLIYNGVTIWPCLHNFCAGCISDWILESEICPNCKQEYSDVKKNEMLNEMINGILEMKPELGESKENCDEKDWKDRIKPLFEEIVTFSDGSVYEGEWVNGRRQGKRKIVYSDGDVYEGEWVKGRREGQGKIIYSNGDVYEGDWKNDQREGKGKMIYSRGGVYEGDWKNDKRKGKGKYIYSGVGVYEGDWKNGWKEGKGKMIYSDGKVYEGDWVNNSKSKLDG